MAKLQLSETQIKITSSHMNPVRLLLKLTGIRLEEWVKVDRSQIADCKLLFRGVRSMTSDATELG